MPNAQFFNEMFGTTPLAENIRRQVIDYLTVGKISILEFMGFTTDLKTGEIMCPYSYNTDGYFVWPAYLPAHLERYPDFIIDNEFLNFMKNRNFVNDVKENKDFNFDDALQDVIASTNGRVYPPNSRADDLPL